MNIDWSKAPQATHYTPGNPEEGLNAVYWRVIEGVTVKAWAVRSSGSIAECLSSCAFDLNRPDVIVKVWDGEGLPPVGIEIEALLPGLGSTTYFWQRAKVVHGALPDSPGEVLVFSLETTRPAWVDEFRPVRTPEQVAMEARKAAVEAMAEELKSLSGPKCLGVLYGIYDLGYRKQVEP
ncbi:hypothetical protein [Pseudomonas sp.]|uniref:hypothetical protein n=1 Tax=Pseudomonas sp. TaxID=306 RepID=UPI003FD77546